MHALVTLQALYRAQQNGETLRLEKLQGTLHVGLEESEEILERLEAAQWVSRTATNGWVLNRAPEQITLADIFHEFVYRTEIPQVLPDHLKQVLPPWLNGIQASLQGTTNLTLKALCEAVKPE